MKQISTTRVALGCLLLIILSVSVTALLVRAPRPDSLEAPESATTFDTSEQEFTDERVVDLELELGTPLALVSQKAGTITSSQCRPGMDAVSGGSTIEVDGVTIVDLATSRPLWRDLAAGDSGNDVLALQEELVRLGHPTSPTGTVDDATQAVAAALGLTDGPAVVARERIVWLPAQSTPLDTCDLVTGQNVETGAVFATAPPPLKGLSLSTLPEGTTADDRILVVDHATFDLGPDARITDPAALKTLGELPSVVAHRASDQTTLLTGVYRLADPRVVVAVPARALVAAAPDQSACVSAGGTGVPVTVVGSELGRSLVAFPYDAVPHQVDLLPDPAMTCS